MLDGLDGYLGTTWADWGGLEADLQRCGGVEEDVHGLGHAYAVHVLDQAQDDEGCAAAVVDDVGEAAAVEHLGAIQHICVRARSVDQRDSNRKMRSEGRLLAYVW